MNDQLKAAAKKKILMYLAPGAISFGCFIFALLGFAAIFGGIIYFIASFEFGMNEDSEFADMVDKTNEDMAEVVSEILRDHPSAQINGPLIASTILTLKEYNGDYAIPEDDDDYDPESYADMDPVSRSTIKELAIGMLATTVTLTCKEDNPPSGSTATTRVYTYVKELVGIGGIVKEECEDGFSEESREETLTYSLEYYKIVFLPVYIASELNLNIISDREEIDSIISQIVEDFDVYQATVYEDGVPPQNLVGIKVINTSPIIVGDQSLPLGIALNITSGFGPRIHPVNGGPDFHQGIDLSCARSNPPIYSVYSGKVLFAGYDKFGAGNYVIVESMIGTRRLRLVYSHLFIINASIGQSVAAGDKIGLCGTTGSSTGEHLHFEMRESLPSGATCSGYTEFSKCYLNPTSTILRLEELSKGGSQPGPGPTIEVQ